MCGKWLARVLLREIQEEVEAIEDLVSIMVPYIPSADPKWTQTFIASGILGGLDYSMSGSILGDY